MVIEKENASIFESRQVQKIYCRLKKRLQFNDQYCINFLGNAWVQSLVYEVYFQRLDFENLVYNVEKKMKKLQKCNLNRNHLIFDEVLATDIAGS